jgi:transposase
MGAAFPVFADRSCFLAVHDRLLRRQGSPARNGRPKRGGLPTEETGRSRGGLTTKLHAVTDAQGRVAALKLSPGQAHDLAAAYDLLDAVPADTVLLADKAYDADAFMDALAERDICPNIPNRSNRKEKRGFFPSLYKLRNAVERFFSKLKRFRRIATRYEKRAANFLAMCQLASARILMRDL